MVRIFVLLIAGLKEEKRRLEELLISLGPSKILPIWVLGTYKGYYKLSNLEVLVRLTSLELQPVRLEFHSFDSGSRLRRGCFVGVGALSCKRDLLTKLRCSLHPVIERNYWCRGRRRCWSWRGSDERGRAAQSTSCWMDGFDGNSGIVCQLLSRPDILSHRYFARPIW